VAGTALGARQRGDIDVAYVWREVVAAVPRRNAPAGPVFSSTHPHRRRRRDQKTRPKTPGDPGSASGTVSGARGRLTNSAPPVASIHLRRWVPKPLFGSRQARWWCCCSQQRSARWSVRWWAHIAVSRTAV